MLDKALESVPKIDFRESINQPTGNFFYDRWEIKPEFKNTIWDEILNTLPNPIGEARIIILQPATCYTSHSDIDDRWHLTISSKNSYLIDLDKEEMFKLKADGIWYYMNAGLRHSAVNFGNRPRIQLVVRNLLNRSDKKGLINVSIFPKLKDLEDARYEFDNSFSLLLNTANKENSINNFLYNKDFVSIDIMPEHIDRLFDLAGENFKVIIND